MLDQPSAPPADEAPKPTFDALPLSAELRATLADIGYTHPTPVQLSVFEPATRGKDLVVQARTGTGKTASFGLPLADQLVRKGQAKTQALVLCPTRELAIQVSAELERLGGRKGIRVAPIYGGAAMQPQVQQLASGVQVVVGTPGRVLDHLERKTLDPSGIRTLVLDEADEMLSMGFERDLTAILDHLPRDRQTLLFSATLPPEIERMARNRLRQPEFLTLSSDQVGALTIDHFVYMVSADKSDSLLRIIEVENPESAIVFCNTREETENVSGALRRAGFEADWLNGDLPQGEREEVIRRTREGKLRFLVATDVAARGIDISHLTHVINYDFPQDAESYVHRTGRTGRAGRTGTAISLIAPRDVGGLYYLRLTYKIRPQQRELPSSGELATRKEADVIQMLLDGFASKGTTRDTALARRLLTHEDGERVVAGLIHELLGARPDVEDEAARARRATPLPPSRLTTRERKRARDAERGGTDDRRGRGPRPAAYPGRADSNAADAERAVVAPAPPAPPASLVPPELERAAVEASRAEPQASDAQAEPARSEPAWAGAEDREARAGRRRRRGERDSRRAAPAAPSAGGSTNGSDKPEPGPASSAFLAWEPQPEANDDEPILAHDDTPPAALGAPADATDDDPCVELFVSVGRRDSIRAGDIAQVLEKAGLAVGDIRRVRVRDRHSFVSVPREESDRAIAALRAETVGGKAVTAELSRRTVEGE
jgi:ATP-dependent RNA helicase DeaD